MRHQMRLITLTVVAQILLRLPPLCVFFSLTSRRHQSTATHGEMLTVQVAQSQGLFKKKRLVTPNWFSGKIALTNNTRKLVLPTKPQACCCFHANKHTQIQIDTTRKIKAHDQSFHWTFCKNEWGQDFQYFSFVTLSRKPNPVIPNWLY